MISFDDFQKLDIKIGEIKSAEEVEGANRLLRLKVDVGEEKERQIISGIKEHFTNFNELVGRKVPVLINLETKEIMGNKSEGMILYVVGEDNLTTLEPSDDVENGTSVK